MNYGAPDMADLSGDADLLSAKREGGVGISLVTRIGKRSVGQPVLHGIAHHVGHIMEVHLFHQVGFMGADRLVADEQLLGDFIDALAGDQQAENLELAI